MEYIDGIIGLVIIILAWAVYRLYNQVSALREKVFRLGKRLNETLYKVTRPNKEESDKDGWPSIVDVADEVSTKRKVICPNCKRECSSTAVKCYSCGASLTEGADLEWDERDK